MPHWQYQQTAEPPLNAVGRVITPADWIEGWQLPFRSKHNTALMLVKFVIAPEQPGALGIPWFYPYRDPVRILPSLRAALQQTFTTDPFNQTQTETVFESEWHFPWTDPVRVRAGLLTSDQREFTIDTGDIIDPRDLKWYAPLSEPVRTKPLLRIGLHSFQAQSWSFPSFATFAWYAELERPPKPPKGQHVWLQRDFTVDPIVFTQGEFIREWFNPMSEPVRLKIGLGAWLQSFYATPVRNLPTPNVFVTLAGTEVNNDSMSVRIGVTGGVLNGAARVSVTEIVAERFGTSSIVEEE